MHTKYITYGNKGKEENFSYLYVPSFLFQITTLTIIWLQRKKGIENFLPYDIWEEAGRLYLKKDNHYSWEVSPYLLVSDIINHFVYKLLFDTGLEHTKNR